MLFIKLMNGQNCRIRPKHAFHYEENYTKDLQLLFLLGIFKNSYFLTLIRTKKKYLEKCELLDKIKMTVWKKKQKKSW